MRCITRKDAHHTETVKWLRGHGWEVCDLSAVGIYPDLLCAKGKTISWVELKISGSRARWYATQLSFLANTKMPVVIAESKEQALEKLRTSKYLSQNVKDRIAAVVGLNSKKSYTPAEIAKLI